MEIPLNLLLVAFCSASPIEFRQNANTSQIHTAYRKCLRCLWGIPSRTHNAILPSLTGNVCSYHMCIKRGVKYAQTALQHYSPAVRYVFRNALKHSNSIFAKNVKLCCTVWQVNDILTIDLSSLAAKTADICRQNCQTEESRVVAGVIYELILVRNNTYSCPLQTDEVHHSINELCTK